ncbi:MAG: right-handed parallel beta-helix repeat-containing protein, partial [Oscillospiraceae bacterium]|nr:right-handed parallel beta-helix repeat-containing protein [Oscillospiraceae bacterium]
AVLSTQWFNPLSYLVRRELNRACELSCDEILLRDMDRADKLSYGHTLLNMAAAGSLPSSVAATTFSTEKRNLKERLEQIMHYKKSGTRLLAAVLALVLLAGCAALAGPLPRAAAEEQGAETVVRVSNVDELLAGIAPDTTIELEAGTYDLTTASDYGQDTHSAYYSWNGAYDGFELTLHNLDKLTIRGAGKGSTVLAAVPRYANVLKISNCRNVALENLTAGHTTEPGFCMGGVLSFEMTDNASIENCGLYGCGTIGVQARECHGLTVKSTEIYECSYGAVSLHSCRNVTVTECDIHDHGTRAGQGDAMFLFDVNYSEDAAIYKNRIHDNRAQYMLMGDYARRVLFLTNEVRGNSFVSSVFQFRQYGATVDGCVFEGNDVRGGWYQGDVYAGDIDGNLLEGAVLAEMTYRDIDPATASPLASVGDPTEVPKGGSITVSAVDDFLAAIGPDRTILLDGALFDLSTASNYGGIGTAYYYWAENYDGPQLVIHDVNGLSIQAQNTESGATTLAAIPRYADVIYFRNCDNLFLGGFTAGHTKEPGSCSGGVLRFEDCNQVMLEKMRLFGCGILGIQASRCSSLDILRTEIYECSQGAAQFFRTDGIRFQDCDIHDVPTPALSFSGSGDKTWNGEPINGLDGQYDVGSDGTLIACSIESSGGDVLVIPEDSPEYTFLSEIQKDIARGDWETLADNMAFPLTIVIPSEKHDTNYVHIPNKETFLSRELDQIMNIQYRRYVENARIGTATPTIWGYAALDESICFTVSANDAPKVTALIISASRIAASQNVNPFNSEPPIPFEEGTPQLDFAKAVQKAFAEQDWDALAAKIEFPLQLNRKDRYSMVQSAEDFHSMVHGSINPFTPEFCELIVNADLATYGASIFGSTFAAHRLAFSCVSDILRTADDLRITCISFDEPLYRYQAAQALPPTQRPAAEGIRVMFYETEIKTDCTLWPDRPIELNARISPEIAAGAEFEWKTDNPSVLRAEKTGPDTANITCIDDGTL